MKKLIAIIIIVGIAILMSQTVPDKRAHKLAMMKAIKEYVDENEILGKADNPDKAYVEQIMPDKIRYNKIWIENQTVAAYFRIIFTTLSSIIR